MPGQESTLSKKDHELHVQIKLQKRKEQAF